MSADCDDPETVRCPRCGTENPTGNRFCGEYGGRLDGDDLSARRPQVIYGDSPAHCLIYDSDEPLESLESLADLDRSKVILPEGAEWVGENKVRFADGRTRRFIDADKTLVLRYPAIALIFFGYRRQPLRGVRSGDGSVPPYPGHRADGRVHRL